MNIKIPPSRFHISVSYLWVAYQYKKESLFLSLSIRKEKGYIQHLDRYSPAFLFISVLYWKIFVNVVKRPHEWIQILLLGL